MLFGLQFVIFVSKYFYLNNFSIAIHGGTGILVKGLMTPELEAQY